MRAPDPERLGSAGVSSRSGQILSFKPPSSLDVVPSGSGTSCSSASGELPPSRVVISESVAVQAGTGYPADEQQHRVVAQSASSSKNYLCARTDPEFARRARPEGSKRPTQSKRLVRENAHESLVTTEDLRPGSWHGVSQRAGPTVITSPGACSSPFPAVRRTPLRRG